MREEKKEGIEKKRENEKERTTQISDRSRQRTGTKRGRQKMRE